MPSAKNSLSVLIISTSVLAVAITTALWTLWRHPLVLAASQIIILKDRKLLWVFIICGVGGTVVEATAIHLGGWQYVGETFCGVPAWLLPGWGIMSMLAVSIHKILSEIQK